MPPRFSKEIRQKVIFPDWQSYQHRTSPCEAHCPAGNPIQKVFTLIAEERTEEALAYLRSRNPFPGVTGRVCPHPCEQNCNRNHYDGAVSIRALERFAADHANPPRVTQPRKSEPSGKTLAIIGSGPAGMTCAYFSALLGHDVTVFESASVLGGIPRIGVPDFRMPKHIVEKEIEQILELGVRVQTNTTVGKDIAFNEIVARFDACLVAVGAWQERRLAIPGVESSLSGLPFLRQVNLGRKEPIGDRVVIVGGGGVAFDCALTSKRLGAAEVHIVCVEDKRNMRAPPEDVEQAEAEGVRIHRSRLVSGILTKNGKTTGIEYIKISSFQFNSAGRLFFETAGGQPETLAADAVICSVGEQPDLKFIEGKHPFQFTSKGTLEVDPETLATSVNGVFGAGDAVLGPSTVAEAIGSGRRAAIAIDDYFRGSHPANVRGLAIDDEGRVVSENDANAPNPHVVAFNEILNLDYHERKPRQDTEKLPSATAPLSFEEIDKGMGPSAASFEAGRCFHCGHCISCGSCVIDCPGLILGMTPEGPQVVHFDECWHCGCCRIACPTSAINYEFPLNMLV